jgi:hypothetical protein
MSNYHLILISGDPFGYFILSDTCTKCLFYKTNGYYITVFNIPESKKALYDKDLVCDLNIMCKCKRS